LLARSKAELRDGVVAAFEEDALVQLFGGDAVRRSPTVRSLAIEVADELVENNLRSSSDRE
jgi:hypothetical protein